MYIFGLEQKIKRRGASVRHLLEWAPIGGHCPGSDFSGTLVLPAVSEQRPLSGPHTQLWAKAFWQSAEDTFLLPIASQEPNSFLPQGLCAHCFLLLRRFFSLPVNG